MFDHTDPLAIGAVILALVLGGVLKGATGAGAPVIAVPVIAALFDIRVAVVIMATPNLLTNIWQMWQYRGQGLHRRFRASLAIFGAAGAIVGTVGLSELPLDALQVLMAGVVMAYIALRFIRPNFVVGRAVAERVVRPVAFAAGLLQGSAGISAPVSLSFLNAMRLSRPEFIATIAVFFAAMSAVQIVALAVYDLMTWHMMGFGVLAVVPLLAGMPLGAAIASRVGPKAFDRAIMILLAILACRLIWSALA